MGRPKAHSMKRSSEGSSRSDREFSALFKLLGAGIGRSTLYTRDDPKGVSLRVRADRPDGCIQALSSSLRTDRAAPPVVSEPVTWG